MKHDVSKYQKHAKKLKPVKFTLTNPPTVSWQQFLIAVSIDYHFVCVCVYYSLLLSRMKDIEYENHMDLNVQLVLFFYNFQQMPEKGFSIDFPHYHQICFLKECSQKAFSHSSHIPWKKQSPNKKMISSYWKWKSYTSLKCEANSSYIQQNAACE